MCVCVCISICTFKPEWKWQTTSWNIITCWLDTIPWNCHLLSWKDWIWLLKGCLGRFWICTQAQHWYGHCATSVLACLRGSFLFYLFLLWLVGERERETPTGNLTISLHPKKKWKCFPGSSFKTQKQQRETQSKQPAKSWKKPQSKENTVWT